MDVFKTMDVKPPMVISLAKKEELAYTQARAEPIKLQRNNVGLKMLQYLRDEAHRFAQHYHHILRRKSQLEEDEKSGRRPPARRKPRKDPASIEKEAQSGQGHVSDAASPLAQHKQVGEMPHTTHASLPILQPRPELPEELPNDVSMDAEDADEQLPPPPRPGRGVQATHVTPPDPQG